MEILIIWCVLVLSVNLLCKMKNTVDTTKNHTPRFDILVILLVFFLGVAGGRVDSQLDCNITTEKQ